VIGPPTPTAFTATAVSTTSVNTTWNPSAGAAGYIIERVSSDGSSSSHSVGNVTSYLETNVPAGMVHQYRIRALDNASRGSLYRYDLATTIAFTDDPLPVGTKIKKAHIIELRNAVNALRALGSASAATFTDPVLTASTVVKKAHVQELRDTLTSTLNSMSYLERPALVFTDTNLTVKVSKPRVQHIQELRNVFK